MDLVLNMYDKYFFTPYIYPENSWPEDDCIRRFISLYVIVFFHAAVLYLVLATFNYVFLFDKNLFEHKLFLKNQIQQEIKVTFKHMPFISLPTAAIFWCEIYGYSKLYDSQERPYGLMSLMKESISFIIFTDMLIYFVHRACHYGYLYRYFHKVHHMWIISTPYASHAMHWFDSFLQSFPYHLYAFLFPIHKISYLMFFVFVNIWSVNIHDGYFAVPKLLRSIINGSAHHYEHHRRVYYNYGQFFTFWDRLMNSYFPPSVKNE